MSEALSGDGGGDDGLLQRLQLIVWPDSQPAWKNVDRYPETEAKRNVYALFKRLDALRADEIEAAAPDDYAAVSVPTISFSPEAQDLFDAWRAGLEQTLQSYELRHQPALESHLAKYRSLMPSLKRSRCRVAARSGVPSSSGKRCACRRARARPRRVLYTPTMRVRNRRRENGAPGCGVSAPPFILHLVPRAACLRPRECG